MKTSYLKMNWLIPVLGIAVVAGTVWATTTYFKLEREADAEQAFIVIIDRLYQDCQLSAALKAIHAGEVKGAAQRLDLLLCDNILRTDSERASADARTRAFVGDAFERIARVRPRTGNGAVVNTAQERRADQTAAERILSQALAVAHPAQAK